jgi:ABC transport system ATP-binding/permease protein
MAAPLLSLENIYLTFGGTPLLEGANLAVAQGERLCLVGRNGSGKSTLMKIASGLIESDRGERSIAKTATVRYLPQEPDFGHFPTTLDYVLDGLTGGNDPHRARTLLEDLGLDGSEDPAHLSGGQSRRTALARVLAAEPDILLLDEPTNHLDLPAIEWLESTLKSIRSAIVLISHDRRFLTNLSRATVWLDRGTTRRIERGFGHFEAWRDEVFALEEAEQHKLDRRIHRETQWMHYGGVTARRARNEGRKRRLDAMRLERREATKRVGQVRLQASESEASGKIVIEAKHVSKTYADRPIVSDVSVRITRGDRIGVVGPNGAGKTTLVDLLTGTRDADAGTVKLGANVQMVTLDQKRQALDPEMTLTEALTGNRGDRVTVAGQTKHVVAYMQDFLFSPEQARSPLKVLSGGERGRLMLARALAMPSNLLVLDEPTNDLDLETLDLLEDLLADYAGTVILVSHDRDFLDRVVTSVLMSEGEGRWIDYAGGYTDMLAQRGAGVSTLKTQGGAISKSAGKPVALAATPASTQVNRKMSFKDKHALETLPGTIAKLETEIAALDGQLADPSLYVRDAKRFAELATRSAAAKTALATAEEEWLRLELLRTEIEEG